MHGDDKHKPGADPRTRHALGLAILTLALAAAPAQANPGTAMLWPIVFHFVVGNLLIGAAEWLGLWLLGASKLRAAVMIPANYLSGLVGIAISRKVVPDAMLEGAGVFENMTAALLLSMTAFAAIGIILELPFAAMAFKKPRPRARIVLGCIAVNAITSVGLSWYYLGNSDSSLADSFKLVPLAEIDTNGTGDLWIYFISNNDTAVSRMRADGSQLAEFVPLKRASRSQQDGYSEYSLSLLSDYSGGPALDMVVTRFGDTVELIREDLAERGSLRPSLGGGVPLNRTPVADLRDPGTAYPAVYSSFVSISDALAIRAHEDAPVESFALYNPVIGATATPKHPTVLSGNLIVLELGGIDSNASHGMYLLDVDTRTLAYLGPGRSPVVVAETP